MIIVLVIVTSLSRGKLWPNGLRVRLVIKRLRVRVGRNCRWREWMSSALSIPRLSKAPNPQLLPGCRSINGCPLLRVCVHCWLCAHWIGKCRAWIQSLGHHTWSYVMSLSYFIMWLYISQFDFISHSCDVMSDNLALYIPQLNFISHSCISLSVTLYLTMRLVFNFISQWPVLFLFWGRNEIPYC